MHFPHPICSMVVVWGCYSGGSELVGGGGLVWCRVVVWVVGVGLGWGGDGMGLIWEWCGGGVGAGLGWRSGGVGRCGLAPGCALGRVVFWKS